MLLINILMSIFAILALGIGIYLIFHQKKGFFIFKVTNHPGLSTIILLFGFLFLISGIISGLSVISQNTIIICGALIFGCIVVTGFNLCISKFFPKAKK